MVINYDMAKNIEGEFFFFFCSLFIFYTTLPMLLSYKQYLWIRQYSLCKMISSDKYSFLFVIVKTLADFK